MTNKYFTGYVVGKPRSFESFLEVESAHGLILFVSSSEASDARAFLEQRQDLLESLEVKFLFSLCEDSALQRLATEYDFEYEWQDFGTDSTLKLVDGERVGIGRVLEALEVGCASFASRSPAEDEGREDELGSESGNMRDIDVFEELMEKVRRASENAKGLSDEERRIQAERVILEVVERLGIDES